MDPTLTSTSMLSKSQEKPIVIDLSKKEHMDFINQVFKNKKIAMEGLSKVVLKGNMMTVSYADGKRFSQEIDKDIAHLATKLLFPQPQPTHARLSAEQELNQVNISFDATIERFEKCLNSLYSNEDKKMEELLNKLLETYTRLANATSLEEINQLKTELDEFSMELQENFEIVHKTLFTTLEKQLIEMTKAYNEILDDIEILEKNQNRGPQEERLLENLKQTRHDMHAKIHDCNEKMCQRSLTTNIYTAYRSYVMDFASIVEKRYALAKESSELHSEILALRKKADALEESIKMKKDKHLSLDKNEETNLNTLRTQIKENLSKKKSIDHALSKAPNLTSMETIYRDIKQKLSGLNELVSLEEIRHEYSAHSAQFQWGQEYRGVAFTTPANWTTISNAFVKESDSGKMFVCVTKNEPLNISEKGGVPAWLRDAKGRSGYKTRAANLFKTTHYTNVEGQKVFVDTSFRGAQFPTVSAAKEALREIIEESMESNVPLELHINALLTPTSVSMFSRDKRLLVEHGTNIRQAIIELREEYESNHDLGRAAICTSLEDHIAISNFGVNEAAVGTYGISLGWHTSIGEYDNEASQKLTASLENTLEVLHPDAELEAYEPAHLDRLGSIVQVGLEMEAAWAQNTFADGEVGNNQFKLPVLWKVMDSLIGVRCYTNCMSGKDRTGKVVSHAQGYLDEIAMNTAVHKKKLDQKVATLSLELNEPERSEWNKLRPYLTAACFTLEEIDGIYAEFRREGQLESILKRRIDNKLEQAQTALGMRDKSGHPQPFLVPKTVEHTRKPGTKGISTTEPKINNPRCREASKTFPRLTPSTLAHIYEFRWDDLDSLRMELMRPDLQHPTKSSEYLRLDLGFQQLRMEFQKRQREAENVWLSQLNSLSITQTNTGKPGFKVNKGEPLARASSGFDRDYVLLTIWGYREGFIKNLDINKEFADLVGLDQFDPDTQEQLKQEFNHAIQNQDTAKCIKQCVDLLKKIEAKKVKNFSPRVKVKA